MPVLRATQKLPIFAIVLALSLLCACVPAATGPKSGPTLTAGEREETTSRYYLPRVFGSRVVRYLPAITRNAEKCSPSHPCRRYLPLIQQQTPVCVTYGADCVEPNDVYSSSVRMSVLGRPYYGTVFTGTSDASDYFVATFVSGVAYSITLGGGIGLGAPFPAGNDLDLYVYAVGGAPPVAQSNFTGFLAEEVRYVAPASGDYYLRAYGFRTPGGPVPYRIEARVVP